jgi:hypothetical protein
MSENKAKAREIEAKVEAVLKREFGDQVRMDGGSFDALTLTLRVKLPLVSGEAQKVALREQFIRVGKFLGLVPSDADLTVIVRGRRYKLVGVELGRSKYPFVVASDDGDRLKVTADSFLVARARAGTADQQRKDAA